MTNQNPGEWSHFDFTLTPQAKDAFETAMQPMFGAKYTPLAFARRSGAVANYCFLCDVQHVMPPPNENAVMVYIYQMPDGNPFHYRIVPISP